VCLSASVRAHVWLSFARLDSNRDGVVSIEELRGALAGLPYLSSGLPDGDPAHLDELMRALDLNGDGQVRAWPLIGCACPGAQNCFTNT
jgi:Ca2+-binding EF-hand superfamily protein